VGFGYGAPLRAQSGWDEEAPKNCAATTWCDLEILAPIASVTSRTLTISECDCCRFGFRLRSYSSDNGNM
jgi:hypothetical protein